LTKYKFKTSIIPFWLDIELAVSDNEHTLKTINDSYFLYFGRLAAYKGLEEIVAAIIQLDRNINFVIAGNGEKRSLLESIKKFPNVKIIEGNISEEEKYEIIKKSYFLLFPSTSENEAFGIVQLEAMSQGVPIINTNLNSGVPWVARDDREAITIAQGSSDELIIAIERAISSTHLQALMSNNARNRYADFEKNKLQKQLIATFKQ
jgi:rhamnosyl/mannosyltransferase